MPTLGAIGTLVRDTIHTVGGGSRPLEDWGGITYSLAAFEAVRPPGWSLLPIVKVGRDVKDAAEDLLSGFETLDSLEGVRPVPESNNRVEITYHDESRRTEKLTGGVPGWSWDELAPLALSCDAVYVNFIAGWELDLECARNLRDATDSGGAPLYCDLHSLLLAVGEDGVRVRRTPPEWREWVGSFDLVQINGEELETLAREARDDPEAGDGSDLAAGLVSGRTRGLFVTRGEEGVSWFAVPALRRRGLAGLYPAVTSGSGSPSASGGGSGASASELAARAERGTVAADPVGRAVDPTGCGDVWGMTCFARLLEGEGLEEAAATANLLAGRNAGHRGTTNLAIALQETLP